MPRTSPYSLDFKLQIVREYDEGLGGYKTLAAKYNLSRDLVRSWVANAKLHTSKTIPQKDSAKAEKDLEFYKAAAAQWEEYAHKLEAQLAGKNK